MPSNMVILAPSKIFNSPIRPINEILTGTTTSGLSGPESNYDEAILHIPQTRKIQAHHQMELSVIDRTKEGKRLKDTDV